VDQSRTIQTTISPWKSDCPSREILQTISHKWALLVLPLLRGGPQRNGMLLKQVQGISQKMLTHTLRDLQARNIVYRLDHQEVPPRVEYGLTPLGHSLAEILSTLDDWVIRHYDELSAGTRTIEPK